MRNPKDPEEPEYRKAQPSEVLSAAPDLLTAVEAFTESGEALRRIVDRVACVDNELRVVDCRGFSIKLAVFVTKLQAFKKRREKLKQPPAPLKALEDELDPNPFGRIFVIGKNSPKTLDYYDRQTDLKPAHYKSGVSRKTPRR